VPPDSALFNDTATATAVTVAGPLAPATVIFANSTKNFTLASSGGGIAEGASLAKTGTGTLTLSTGNTFTGGTTVAGGTLAFANDTATSTALGTGIITLSGGTMQMFDNSSTFNAATWNLEVPAGATGTLRADSRIDLSGTLTGSGILNLYVPWVRTTLLADWSAFAGRINVVTDADGGDFRVANVKGLPATAVHLDPKVTASWYPNSAGTIPLGELSGEAASQLRGVVNNNNTPGAYVLTWEVGALGTDATFSGNITNGSSPSLTAIRKVGAGIWTLAGTNTFTGPTTVVAGTLRVIGSTSGTTGLTVQSGAVLEIVGGTFAVSGAITNNGIVRVLGSTLPTATGTFTNNGVLDLINGPSALPPRFVNAGVVLDSSAVRTRGISTSGGVVAVTIQGYPGHSYQLQRSDTLAPAAWQNLGTSQRGDGGILTFTDSPTANSTRGYYRVVVSP
jgi:autotransporter-associated beta strand protein